MTGRQLRPTDVKRLNRAWRRRTRGRLALLVESVTSPFNIGSIARSAAVFGVECIWLTGNAATPEHASAKKTSLGTDRFMAWERVKKPGEAAESARGQGFRLVAVELTTDAEPLHELPLSGDMCLAIGAEEHGCSPALLDACDAVAYIPQVGRVGSLNVAVAAGVALAEVRRYEWAAATEAGADTETGTGPAGR